MAARIFAMVALLALSTSAATAFTVPQYFSPISAAVAANAPLSFPLAVAASEAHPCVQYIRLQQAIAAGISLPAAVIIQQPLAYLQQQCLLAHSPIQAIAALQQQQQQQILPSLINQLAVANPAIYLQQQQLLPYLFNQVATANPAAFLQQQQPFPYSFNQLVVPNPAAFSLLFSQFAAVNPAAFYQQPFVGGALF